ncbi:MAG: 50S ribosomal protein L28 [Armatimonadota bacterium]
MARCYVCNKGTSTGNNRSNSMRATKRTWKPNLQRVRALVDNKPKRIHVCTSCLKAGKVRKAARG